MARSLAASSIAPADPSPLATFSLTHPCPRRTSSTASAAAALGVSPASMSALISTDDERLVGSADSPPPSIVFEAPLFVFEAPSFVFEVPRLSTEEPNRSTSASGAPGDASAESTADSTAKRTDGSSDASGSTTPTTPRSHSETAPPSRGSSGGAGAPPPPPPSPPSRSAAIARSCAPASSVDSACNPGSGDASPQPTLPSSSWTLSRCPRRVPAVSLASPSVVVGFLSMGSSNPRTDADATRGIPLDDADADASSFAPSFLPLGCGRSDRNTTLALLMT
mmetsp:Transcript_13018/g.52468  ORF Transcript_13018/g.52468 Transcript_13018/m.52468 type:complete len:280 (+) Transcript_13018:3220-4059(+)